MLWHPEVLQAASSPWASLLWGPKVGSKGSPATVTCHCHHSPAASPAKVQAACGLKKQGCSARVPRKPPLWLQGHTYPSQRNPSGQRDSRKTVFSGSVKGIKQKGCFLAHKTLWARSYIFTSARFYLTALTSVVLLAQRSPGVGNALAGARQGHFLYKGVIVTSFWGSTKDDTAGTSPGNWICSSGATLCEVCRYFSTCELDPPLNGYSSCCFVLKLKHLLSYGKLTEHVTKTSNTPLSFSCLWKLLSFLAHVWE